MYKYQARNALRVIDEELATELRIYRFDSQRRSKAQLFAMGGEYGRQFAIIVGDMDADSGLPWVEQTRLLFERCELPNLPGIEPCVDSYLGSRIKQQDSKLAPPNQVSVVVQDESALRSILRWYAGARAPRETDGAIEYIRVEKAANDAGFDLSSKRSGDWLLFRSSAFPLAMTISVQPAGVYRFGVDDAKAALRLSEEFDLQAASEAGPLTIHFGPIEGYEFLYKLTLRAAAVSRVISQEGFREFASASRNLPPTTEALREVKQRIGQEIFRRSLIEYWGGRCAVSGLDVVELLRASHIKPWADCDNDSERLDVFNGLLLAPQLDALFDKGFLSFSDQGHMLCSQNLSARQRKLLGIETATVRPLVLTEEHRAYLRWHRERVFRIA